MLQQKMPKSLLFILGFSLLSILVVFTSNAITAVASETLPPGVIIGDEAGISASSEGEYYVDLPNVQPGEKYEKTITIRSLDVKEPFELGMLITPKSSEGHIQLGEKIILTLSIDEKEIYKGPLLGNEEFDWTIQPLVLGTCRYGTDQVLKAEFEVSDDLVLNDYKEESQLLYDWTFIATKNQPKEPSSSESTPPSSSIEKPKTKGQFPMTGEEIKNLLYKILSGLLLVLISILLWKKRKEEQQTDI
ncbi:LPXTG cell wall anchor domain-containing protein [Enterococcus sp. LJL99]